jgi:hypothetical protein
MSFSSINRIAVVALCSARKATIARSVCSLHLSPSPLISRPILQYNPRHRTASILVSQLCGCFLVFQMGKKRFVKLLESLQYQLVSLLPFPRGVDFLNGSLS